MNTDKIFAKAIANECLTKSKKKEHKKSSVRCKVEHVFAVVKCIFHYLKTLYRSLKKQATKQNIVFALSNLYLSDRFSLSV